MFRTLRCLPAVFVWFFNSCTQAYLLSTYRVESGLEPSFSFSFPQAALSRPAVKCIRLERSICFQYNSRKVLSNCDRIILFRIFGTRILVLKWVHNTQLLCLSDQFWCKLVQDRKGSKYDFILLAKSRFLLHSKSWTIYPCSCRICCGKYRLRDFPCRPDKLQKLYTDSQALPNFSLC